MSNLSVALISTVRGWHGGEEQCRLLARGLRERGHTCHILARRSEAFGQRMREEGFDVVEFAGRGMNLGGLRTLRRALRLLRPDILHCNDSHAVTAGALAAIGLRIPARIASRRVMFEIRSPARYRRFCQRVVCSSQAIARICSEHQIPAGMLRVVHDGVEPARVRAGDRHRGRQSLGWNEKQTLVLTVASLTPPKGHSTLIDALPAVIARRPDVRLVLAGDGETGAALRRQVLRRGMESHVRFLGYRHDVPDLIAACDLFVLPSHSEGFGTSLIDAMLAGRPIVATTAGGIPECLGEDAGWLVSPCSATALSSAIVEALDSTDEPARRIDRARQRAERLFTADRMVEGVLGVYRELAEKVSGTFSARRH